MGLRPLLGTASKAWPTRRSVNPAKPSRAWRRHTVRLRQQQCRSMLPVPTWNGRRSSLPLIRRSPCLLYRKAWTVFERLGAQRYVRRTRQLLYKLGIRPRSTPPRSKGATPLSSTRTRNRPADRRGSDQRRNRRAADHQPAYRHDPPGPHLHPARYQLTHCPGALCHGGRVAATNTLIT